MRRIAAALAATALPFSALAFAPATVDGEEQLPDPVEVTMYFHGDDNLGTVDDDAYAGDSGGILTMDRIAPVDNSYETKQLANYAQGPNARCAGNGLFPVWTGFVGEGTLTGFGSVTFRVLGGTGGEAVVDVFVDVSDTLCNEEYPEPVASTTVTLPTGEGQATAFLDLEGIDPDFSIMVQIRGADSANGVDNPVPNPGAPTWPGRVAPTDPTAQGRIVYDGTNFLSNITFTCQPDALDEDETAEDADCLPF